MTEKVWYIRKGGNLDSKGRPRKEKGKPYACLVTDGKDIGWSVCHKSDIYDRRMGLKIARGRVGSDISDVPTKIRKHVRRMAKYIGLDVVLNPVEF